MATQDTHTILSNVKGGTPDLEDWPVTYEEMVPYYNSWEKAIGVVGDQQTVKTHLFPMHDFLCRLIHAHRMQPFIKTAVQSLGYTPFSTVSGLISGAYVNQYGIRTKWLCLLRLVRRKMQLSL